MQRKVVPVLNSLVFVRDSATARTPDIDGAQHAWRNSTSLAISCQPDSEGDTEIVLSTSPPPSASRLVPIFEGTIETPGRQLVVEVLPDITVFRIPLRHAECRIRVWTDGFQDTRIVWLLAG